MANSFLEAAKNYLGNVVSGNAMRQNLGRYMNAIASTENAFASPETRARLAQMGIQGTMTPQEAYQLQFASTPMMAMQTVYHGTPYNISKFDISKVGTGEGAQAYGHGMYFAENPQVAQQYQSLSNRDLPSLISKRALLQHQGKAIPQELTKQIDQLQANRGNLYKVDLPDTQISKMLDWDKPLSEQPKNIQDALKPYLDKLLENANNPNPVYRTMPRAIEAIKNKSVTGRELYSWVGNGGPQTDSTEVLKSMGIPGIKYLDQGSRGQVPMWHVQGGNAPRAFTSEAAAKAHVAENGGNISASKGTYNYVVFDPSNLKILGKE